MKKTLYFKFLLAYIIFGVFGFIIVSSFVSQTVYQKMLKEKAASFYREANLIANTYAADLYKLDTSLPEVKEQIDDLDVFLSATIWIINPSGTMILSSKLPINVDETLVISGFDPTITGNSYYTTGTFFDSFDEEVLSVFAPITADYKVKGYVVIHSSIADIEKQSDDYLRVCYLLLIILFALSLIILFFFTEMVYVPLRKVTYATEQYASGNLHYEFSIDSDDEMGYLAATLSYMASEIARSEDNQKKFIANVSHDFRSPLTSIRGYLEAMIDGTIPPEMMDKYLGIVLSETERLTKLTNGLLSLNNLNMKGMVLDITDFDINKVIRNTVATFEGTCTAKAIQVDLVLTGDVLPVHADETKIQQVIYNLLDNAIKFSHHNSTIRIETTEKHSKVFVSVKDQGIGIPKDDQKLVFDRFYKSDLSRGRDKKGTGLGLSITKEIIMAHNEHINVISTEGVGSEFIFSLAKTDE
ncbi:MAG: HAMP domain-containing histidine kinase [Lachnospiraceae bacterium]|nr:HAMP domain-containing histidine kinase [Lachnospiraceae bacterium]MCR4934314.1 HAMP domain-containing histidine kinase [Lachnospiraceae bacterium]